MLKKFISIFLIVLLTMSLSAVAASAENDVTKTDKDFTFSNGEMTEEILGNYLSRAVTLQGFCAENEAEDLLFEDDLRMIRRIGAKFIGRAAFYSWGGNMDSEQIENHFKLAKEKAELAHAADSELILQAGIFEIMYEGTVESTAVPEWVLKEFGQTVTKRNFSFDNMLPPKDSIYGRGYWGGKQNTAVPYIGSVETQMYIYYLITRYIDAGYEAVHLGQVELIMNRENQSGSERLNDWDAVLTKARAYAKENARRGVVLFDGHRELNSSGLKVGNRMLVDFYSCGAVAHETILKNGAEHAEMLHYEDTGVSWIGRTPGGIHPLGFEMDVAFTLAEFDNFNGTGSEGQPHIATVNDVYCWGYDIITWYATQPEWYRNQYLLECDEFFKKTALNSDGEQTCFIQVPCRRVICPEDADRPTVKLTLGEEINVNSLLELFEREKITYEIDLETKVLTMTLGNNGFYRANSQSDVCPDGLNQEDTIRLLFLGNVEENPDLLPQKNSVSETNQPTNEKDIIEEENNSINVLLYMIAGIIFVLVICSVVVSLIIAKKKK